MDYEDEYSRRIQNIRYQAQNISEFILSGSSYDAVWAMALGLHSASERVRKNDSSGCEQLSGNLVKLEHFDYQNTMMGCILRQSFHEVNFMGITVSEAIRHTSWKQYNSYCIVVDIAGVR